MYTSSKKGRQLAVNRLTQLLAAAPLDAERHAAIDVLLQRGMAGAGTCTGAHAGAVCGVRGRSPAGPPQRHG